MNKYMLTSMLITLFLTLGCTKENLTPNYDAKLLSVTDRSMLAYINNGIIYNSRQQVIAKFANDTLTNNQNQALGYYSNGNIYNIANQRLGFVENSNIKNITNQTIAIVEGTNAQDIVGLGVVMFSFFLNE